MNEIREIKNKIKDFMLRFDNASTKDELVLLNSEFKSYLEELILFEDELFQLKNELDERSNKLDASDSKLAHKKKHLDDLEEELNKGIKDLEKRVKDYERKCELNDERMEKDNQLIDIKLKRLEQEYEKLEADRLFIEKEKNRLQSMQMNSNISDTGKLLFYGAIDEESIRKRYRELIKIFHPDNTMGNNMASIIINYEYDRLKKIFGSFK